MSENEKSEGLRPEDQALIGEFMRQVMKQPLQTPLVAVRNSSPITSVETILPASQTTDQQHPLGYDCYSSRPVISGVDTTGATVAKAVEKTPLAEQLGNNDCGYGL